MPEPQVERREELKNCIIINSLCILKSIFEKLNKNHEKILDLRLSVSNVGYVLV